MPKISEVITSLLEVQAAIGDQEVVLVGENEADIPLPDASPLGVNIIKTPSKRNGQVKRE